MKGLNMQEHELKLITDLLANRLGLSPRSLGKDTLHRFLRIRMKATSKELIADYYALLLHSPEEFQELVELLVVPETWFFREREGLDFVIKLIPKRWPRLTHDRPLRVLCVPCSTGEEPYSIAMLLLEAGLDPSLFSIDAVDISRKALLCAESLVFGKNSFREKNAHYQKRYFKKKDPIGYVLSEDVSRQVHFYYGNVTDPHFMEMGRRYHIIFCRNLLMYFTRAAQRNVIERLEHLLHPDGYLVLGEAEQDIIRSFNFELISSPKESVYIKALKHDRPQKENSRMLLEKELDKRIASPIANEEEEATLEKALQLADSGHLKEAEMLGAAYLETHKLDPQAYFLMGLLEHASGNERKAQELFEKTLYLDPNHYEALVYLSLLLEKQGKHPRAALIRKRAHKTHLPGDCS